MRLLLLVLSLLIPSITFAQTQSFIPSTPVQGTLGFYALTPISVTGAVNTQVTLTLPQPTTGSFNYVCYLGFNASQSATGAILNNQVTTSTNFNAFALKFSILAVATQANYDWFAHWGTPVGGCVKSQTAATSTTFVSPAAAAQTAFTWYATYFQAP